LQKYGDRPMHLFGNIGIPLGLVGTLILFLLGAGKLWAGLTGGYAGFHDYQIGNRPMLLLGVLLIILGVQFVAMGLLAELLVRTYYESQGKRVYRLRSYLPGEEVEAAAVPALDGDRQRENARVIISESDNV